MIKKITGSIIKPSAKPAVKFLEILNKPPVKPLIRFDKSKSAIRKGLLERNIIHFDRMIKQGQETNEPIKGKIKYRDKLKKDLENFDEKC